MQSSERREVARLIRSQRWGSLATMSGDGPLATMVAYAPLADFSGFLMLLSALAAHTRNLLADPRCSLAISDQDPGTSDPQALPRLSMSGRAVRIGRDTAAFAEAARTYLARLPDSALLFELGDFSLFRLEPERMRFVAGFARAYSFDGAELVLASREQR